MTDDDGVFAHKVVDELVQVEYIISISIGHGLQKRMKVCTVLFPTPVRPITLKSKKKKHESMFSEKKVNSDTRYDDVIFRPFHKNIAPFDLSLPLSHSSRTVAPVDEWLFAVEAFIILDEGSFWVVALQRVHPLRHFMCDRAFIGHDVATCPKEIGSYR